MVSKVQSAVRASGTEASGTATAGTAASSTAASGTAASGTAASGTTASATFCRVFVLAVRFGKVCCVVFDFAAVALDVVEPQQKLLVATFVVARWRVGGVVAW